MKRSFRAKTAKPLFFALSLLALSAPAFAQGTTDPNYLLGFKKIFVEPVQDNVDGAFSAPVMESFHEVFNRNPRFELVQNKEAADTVLRTVLNKKAGTTDVEITMLINGTGEMYTTEHTSIDSKATGRETGNTIKQLLKAALKRIPFYGTITGRDGKELTFDIGEQHGLRKNDIIQISRIDNIKRHPLLKSIVDVQLIPVGSAVIDSVEDTISFGHVHNEIMGESIQKLHKITAVEGQIEQPKTLVRGSEETLGDPLERPMEDGTAITEEKVQSDRPQLGYVGIGPFLGKFSNSTRMNSGVAQTGDGWSLGARLLGELWITKNWFADLQIGFTTVSYTPEVTGTVGSVTTIAPSFNTTTRQIGFNVGYKYLTNGSLYGPSIFAKIGYANFAWSTPIDTSYLLSSKSYSGLNLGIGGTLPVAGPDWGLMLNVNLMLFPSLTEDETFKTAGNYSPFGANFQFGGYRYFNPKLALRVGLIVDVLSADDTQAGSATSQKSIGVLPALLYYF